MVTAIESVLREQLIDARTECFPGREPVYRRSYANGNSASGIRNRCGNWPKVPALTI